MSKDYKDRPQTKTGSRGNLRGYFLTFSLGVLTGFAIALWLQYKLEHSEKSPPPTEANKSLPQSDSKPATPEFDFYQLLPEMEVEVPEYQPTAPETVTTQTKKESGTLYGIQVGAFRQYRDAESLQAQLALLGFEPHISIIQSAKSKWYRVRVGPYTSLRALDKHKRILEKNNLNVMRIQLVK